MWSGTEATLRRLVRRAGFDVLRYDRTLGYTSVMLGVPEESRRTIRAVEKYTATSVEPLTALIAVVCYPLRSGINGGFVECGVWRGGSMMAVALTILAERAPPRHIYLFDTFEGRLVVKPD
jgi:hypothetical protein